jgi:hypothetical protein
VVIVTQCSHNPQQTENLHHVFFNLYEISSETYEMLKKAFVMKTLVEHCVKNDQMSVEVIECSGCLV